MDTQNIVCLCHTWVSYVLCHIQVVRLNMYNINRSQVLSRNEDKTYGKHKPGIMTLSLDDVKIATRILCYVKLHFRMQREKNCW